MTLPPSTCAESRLSASVCRRQSSGAACEMVKWASLPCGTFLPRMPPVDLSCRLIFIASRDRTTAPPVSCISYSLSLSPSPSSALPHPWTLFLRLIYKSTRSLSLPPSPSLPSSLSPSISPCQVLCPSCLAGVYIWWLTFPSVTAPFSPRCASGSARLCIVYLVSPPGEEDVQTILSAVAVSIWCLRARSAVTLLNEHFKSAKLRI